MPSAANAKSEKPASSEALENTPVRQIMTILEHKIRNLEKRKSKLESYRNLQKTGKPLNEDQKIAVAKFDEVAQTLEFARDISKQVASINSVAEKEAKKQAKKEAWVRYASETNKIREVLLIMDCLVQMGNNEVREDFLKGENGAAKLSEEDLKLLDDLYPEVTPKHELDEEGQPGFLQFTTKAAEHLYAIIDGKPKEFLGTTYAHIKEIVTIIHQSGYFDKVPNNGPEIEEKMTPVAEDPVPVEEPVMETPVEPVAAAPHFAPPPAPALQVVPAPGYPLRPLPPITLQEVEHAYFSQAYPQQRPISEVIGSQNFFFLQESEIDSPVSTPQPPMINQASPPATIPTQTFTNQHFTLVPEVPLPPQPHFPPHPEHAGFPMPPAAHNLPPVTLAQPASSPLSHQHQPSIPQSQPQPQSQPILQSLPVEQPEAKESDTINDRNNDEWKESQSPEREENGDRKTQGQGDGQRYRRFGRGGGGGRPTNGYRGRGSYQNRQNSDGYHRHERFEYRSNKEGYGGRQYSDGYQNKHRDNRDSYYGNGDAGEQGENGRERYSDGYKTRGRGGGPRPQRASRPPRQYTARKQDNVE